MSDRRGNGEGSEPSAYRNGFRGQIRLGGKRHDVYGKTAADVRRQYREMLRAHEDGQPVKDAKVKVEAWVETWITTTLEGADKARATKDLYAGLARVHVLPALGTKAIGQVKKADVDALYLAMKAVGLSQSTLRSVHAVLRWVFREAVDNELIKTSPMDKVKRPAPGGKKATYLSQAQAKALVTALAADPMLLDYVKLMLLTGFRRGEGLGLLWEHVGEASIEVVHQLTRASDGLRLRPVKTEASEAVIPVSGPLGDVLRSRRKALLTTRMAAPAGTWDDAVTHEDGTVYHGLVFTTPLGGPLEPRNVARRFEAAVVAAGLPRTVTIHTLRHSAASFLIAAGVPMKVIQKILRHASFTTTSDIYGHVAPELESDAMGKLGEALDL